MIQLRSLIPYVCIGTPTKPLKYKLIQYVDFERIHRAPATLKARINFIKDHMFVGFEKGIDYSDLFVNDEQLTLIEIRPRQSFAMEHKEGKRQYASSEQIPKPWELIINKPSGFVPMDEED